MKNILIIDIETTGFLQKGGHIVEIGIVILSLETGNSTVVFDELVREESMTLEELENSWIVENSDISIDEVMQASLLDKFKPIIQHLIDLYPLGATAFNNKFDFDFLEDRGIKIHKKLPCPMLLSTDIVKLPSVHIIGLYKWPKVQEAWDFFFGETDYIETHRGAHDAQHEAQIVYELYKRKVFKID